MHHSGIRQISRTILTATGIILLIIFGTRAASQATSLAAVGGQAKKATLPGLARPAQLEFLPSDSLRWRAPQSVATNTSASIKSDIATTQASTSDQVSVATVTIRTPLDDAIVAVRQKAELATGSSFDIPSTDKQHPGNQYAQHVTSAQSNNKLLNKSRQD